MNDHDAEFWDGHQAGIRGGIVVVAGLLLIALGATAAILSAVL